MQLNTIGEPAGASASAAPRLPQLLRVQWRPDWRLGVFGLLAALGSALAQSVTASTPLDAGVAAAIGLVCLAVGSMWPRSARPPSAAPASQPSALADQGPAATLSQQLVPVWQRSVEAARGHSERSMTGLLESFASIGSRLDEAMAGIDGGSTLEAGATDDLLQRHRPEIEQLMATTRLAVRLKDDMAAGLVDVAQSLVQMAVLAKELLTIARSNQMLALNAAVEASRAGAAGGGIAVVAQEVELLATESRQAGQRLGRQVQALQDRILALQRETERHDTADDEIERQAIHNARAVIQAVLGNVADFSRSSFALRDASRHVQKELESISMSLQTHDRLSQMLGSVTDDMARYGQWVGGAADPAAASANLWLQRLDDSYTMEEMRSSHHGTVAVERESTVEFF